MFIEVVPSDDVDDSPVVVVAKDQTGTEIGGGGGIGDDDERASATVAITVTRPMVMTLCLAGGTEKYILSQTRALAAGEL